MKNNTSSLLIFGIIAPGFLLLSFFSSCSSRRFDFEVENFRALINYNDTIIYLDYNGAVDNGFVIPSVNQTPTGEFEFEFSVKNNEKQKLFYKIFYQNETYKFPEDHILSAENFYGSWEDVNKGFVEISKFENDGEFHPVSDKFRIVGNPLEDTLYYGVPRQIIDSAQVQSIITQIKTTPEWLASIKGKAVQNNITLERQIYLDAAYVAKDKTPTLRKNDRWKRNPRVGKYSFMLIVCTEEALQKIPGYIQNISIKNGKNFVNPYYYFLYGKGGYHDNILLSLSDKQLRVVAKPDLQKGVYVNHDRFGGKLYSTNCFNDKCNQSEQLYSTAAVEQFIHDIDVNSKFNNIPVVADVTGGEYSVSDYLVNSTKGSRINVPIQVTSCPCATVGVNSAGKSIMIKNPATKHGEWKKENTGIITRHGFTYGKFRTKVKLTKLLNKHNVWNGLTNAVWLYRQTGNWNQRRECYEKGYIAKNEAENKYAKRERKNTYSEIDFEIVKATRNWPKTSYDTLQSRPENPPTDSDKVMVTYTNWDLACQDAEDYGVGLHKVKHGGAEFEIHRWDDWYKAVTGKYAALDDELFKGSCFWFEIEWRPEEIIWRVGPEKNKLKEIGYMNSSVTNIPNNQMLLAITQEWHMANWWPEAPFDQNRIPFPAKDIVGEVLEVEVE